MKNDVGPKIDTEFIKMENYYIKKINESYSDIEKQMMKVKAIFTKKYEQIITQQIKDSEKKEEGLKEQLNQLQNNITLVKNLSVHQ